LNEGVLYIAYGQAARVEACKSIRTLGDSYRYLIHEVHDRDRDASTQAHLSKTNAYELSPFEYTLLLDADTRVRDPKALSLGFKMLKDGWDIVMCPSWPSRPSQVLWHLTEAEKEYTLSMLGLRAKLMLNTGVLFFSRNDRVERLFNLWTEEWLRFKDKDQGAFLRALSRQTVKLFLLGEAFNSSGGAVVDHLFGRAT
jgi:hypothetical protein